MNQKTYVFGNVEIKVIERTTPEERQQRLKEAIKDFYKNKGDK